MAAFGAEPRVLREVLGQEPQPRGIQVDAADGDVGRTDVLHPRFASERAIQREEGGGFLPIFPVVGRRCIGVGRNVFCVSSVPKEEVMRR